MMRTKTFALALTFVLLLVVAGTASGDVVVSGGEDNLPSSLGFVADCSTWSAGESTFVSFWARNDDRSTTPPRLLTLVRGVWYPIDLHTVEEFGDSGACITIDDSSDGGFTRTLHVYESVSSWESPIPSNSGFYVNGPGASYVNWRLDDQEGTYDINGFRYLDSLTPGFFYASDIARWVDESIGGVGSIVTVSP